MIKILTNGYEPPNLSSAIRFACKTINFFTSHGRNAPFSPKINPAIPATYGAAIEVPDISTYASSPVCEADRISSPGATTLTHLPPLLETLNVSSIRVAPTVTAVAARAGVHVQASVCSLPAATAGNTPALSSLSIAMSNMSVSISPPRERTATAGPLLCSRTNSTESSTSTNVPRFFSSSVFTQTT